MGKSAVPPFDIFRSMSRKRSGSSTDFSGFGFVVGTGEVVKNGAAVSPRIEVDVSREPKDPSAAEVKQEVGRR